MIEVVEKKNRYNITNIKKDLISFVQMKVIIILSNSELFLCIRVKYLIYIK